MTLARRWALWMLAVAVLASALGGTGPRAQAAEPPPVPSVVPAAQPAWDADAPDPDVVLVGSTYYAYTTGTVWGNHIGILESDRPDGGFHPLTSSGYGSTAIGPLPAWEQVDTQTSPAVIPWQGGYVMFYDAVDTATAGDYCLSEATSPTPTGPFIDRSSAPLVCQTDIGGSIDPSPFVDPSGQAWLDWKSNGGASQLPAHIWAARLGGGATPALTSAPVQVMTQNTTEDPWETTIENPDMVLIGGTYYLFFAGGSWFGPNYAEGYAVCDTPAGPCQQPQNGPILETYGNAVGPAAGNVFTDTAGHVWMSYAAWAPGCNTYACGGQRRLFVAPLTLTGQAGSCSGLVTVGSVVGMAAAHPGAGYWIADSAGRVATCGSAPAAGDLSAVHLNRPVVGLASTPDGAGYWLVASDGGIFSFGAAAFHGSTGALRLNRPIVGMASTPTGCGYWLVASDGGIFCFGDAAFYGSTGALRLTKPVLGMAATPDGRGYWLVASDGGIFTFGDAAFYGSRGGIASPNPIVGVAPAPGGTGYWLVDGAGGVFPFGSAANLGTTPAWALSYRIVGITPTADGAGYWLVGSDGNVFNLGDAPDEGRAA